MTILATQDSLLDLKSKDKTIPEALRAYFQQRLYSRVHQVLLSLLGEEERSEEFSKRKFACKIEKKPEQITRWLSYPGNMTLETLSDLFLGFGCEMEVTAKDVIEKRREMQQEIKNVFINVPTIKESSVRTFNDPKDVPRVGSTFNKITYRELIPSQGVQSNA